MNCGGCLPFIAISIAVFLCCNALSPANRPGLTIDSAFDQEPQYLNPDSLMVPPNTVDATDEIEPAGAIEPAAQIEPAPAILPSDAINHKERAYPLDKRNGIQNSDHGRQAVQEVIVIEHQMAQSRIKNTPLQLPSSNQTNQNQKPHVFNSAVLILNRAPKKLLPKRKDARRIDDSSKPNLNSEVTIQHKYSQIQKYIVKDKQRTDLMHQWKTPKLQPQQKKQNTTRFETGKSKQNSRKIQMQNKESPNKLSKFSYYKRPKIYNKSKKGHLKKNGAKLYPGSLFVPTPYHFKLKAPTKPPHVKAAKMKKPMKGGSRVIPTQTSFIKPTKCPTKPDKGPMQHRITRPTKKTIAQPLGGCTGDESVSQEKPKQTGKYKPTQTMFLPANYPEHERKVAASKTTYHAQQTLNIKQKHFFAHDDLKPKQPGLSGFHKEHKQFKNRKMSIISDNTRETFKRIAKNGVISKHRTTLKRHAKNWKKLSKSLRESIDKVLSRKRRQLLVPLSVGSQDQMNPLLQSLLPVQPALTGAQQLLAPILTGQTGQQLLPQEALLDSQNLLSPFVQQQGLVQQQPLPQQSLVQPDSSPFLVQPQIALAPALQPVNKVPSFPVISNLAYQNPPVTGAALPVQYQPQAVTGQSRQSIPRMSEYTEEDDYEYPHRRRYSHRFRSSKRNQRYPYDTYSSFEDTYGQSPGVLDDLRDISSRMNEYDDGEKYRHHSRAWVEDGYDDAHVRHHRHHRKPFRAEYSSYEPEDETRPVETVDTRYTENVAPRKDGIDISSPTSPASEQESTDPREEESLRDEDETSENKVKETKLKETNPPSAPHLPTDDQDSDEDQSKRSETTKQLDKDAVMHLDFDESVEKKDTVKDASGNQNDAHLTDGASVTTKTLGTCGRGAILRKGEISYNGASFKRKPTKEVSIAMWVKSKSPGFIRWFDEGDSPNKSFFASTKAASIGKDHWTHLAGTFDTKTGAARIYVNGKLKVEKIGKKNNGLPQDFTSAGIGRKYGDSHVTFLDDVYMFDRVIGPEEVLALYKKCQFNRMVLHFGFQHWNGTTGILQDQSGLYNNATLKGGAKVRAHDCDKCGACLDLQSGDNSEVYLNASKYRQKPKSAVSISAWINLNRTKGSHSVFQALKDGNANNIVYGLEVIDGKVHWQSKDKHGETIFDVLTNEVTIPEGLWSHVTGTYNSKTGEAKIYVNGLLRASFHNNANPVLSRAWDRASIGGETKAFDGLLDEFFMYNWELDPSEVRFVSKYCADKPKLVSFTVKVPIL